MMDTDYMEQQIRSHLLGEAAKLRATTIREMARSFMLHHNHDSAEDVVNACAVIYDSVQEVKIEPAK